MCGSWSGRLSWFIDEDENKGHILIFFNFYIYTISIYDAIQTFLVVVIIAYFLSAHALVWHTYSMLLMFWSLFVCARVN